MRIPAAIFARVSFVSDRLGWIGAYMALYGGAIVAAAWLLVHGEINWTIASLAATLTMSVYLLDRVKPHDRLRDPADAIAHPTRDAFVRRHLVALRILCLLLAAAVIVTGSLVHWAMPVIAIGALFGVLVYGSIPRTQRVQRRPKDVLIVKNLAVACAFSSMTMAMLWSQGLMPTAALPAVGAVAFIGLHIFTDAMLCDIDDARADAQFGTSTIVNQINADGTWQLALLLNIIAAIWLCTMASAEWIAQESAIILAMLLPLGTVIVRKTSPNRVRDAIDLKTPIAVGLAIMLTRIVAST